MTAAARLERIAYIVSKNLHRRHLNESQRAMIAEKLATAKEGQREHPGQICTGYRTARQAAELMNVSRHTVKEARYVTAHGSPEQVAAVERGEAVRR